MPGERVTVTWTVEASCAVVTGAEIDSRSSPAAIPTILAVPGPIGPTGVALPVGKSMVYSDVLPPTDRAARAVPPSVMSKGAVGTPAPQSRSTPSQPTTVTWPRFGEGGAPSPPTRTTQSLRLSMPYTVYGPAPVP